LIEVENSHKGINKKTQINKKMIDSNEYRRKFDNATDNPKVNKALYDSAKAILNERSGSCYETMYWIDGKSGEIITKFNDMGKIEALIGEEHTLKVEYGENILRKLRAYDNIVTIHNHPNSSGPSAGDLNSAYQNNYTTCFTISHNGKVFKYTSKELINEKVYGAYWSRFVNQGYDEFTAQIMAIQKMAENADITITEVNK
jgi:hypothetical protein